MWHPTVIYTSFNNIKPIEDYNVSVATAFNFNDIAYRKSSSDIFVMLFYLNFYYHFFSTAYLEFKFNSICIGRLPTLNTHCHSNEMSVSF
ncbi:hypothetical protein B7P43_G16170 [Cryptotermes secundus]|uniref:Uncharacterized protein n=1 Tax=Cryptotermes secundus TaxID=105785 RepID=A0A2J7Q6I6_9NEOP|nr:hypothetical protein B7P43_G16170 [Cryptotermes secundus]